MSSPTTRPSAVANSIRSLASSVSSLTSAAEKPSMPSFSLSVAMRSAACRRSKAALSTTIFSIGSVLAASGESLLHQDCTDVGTWIESVRHHAPGAPDGTGAFRADPGADRLTLVRNRFAVAPSRVPMAIIVTLVSLNLLYGLAGILSGGYPIANQFPEWFNQLGGGRIGGQNGIPIPAIVFNQITFPLQLLASRMARDLLPLFGVPVLREGNVIELPAMKLEVAEACSGIRSLMSLFTLAVFYGYFLEKSISRRVVLALASIPIAIAANALRILGTGLCVQYWDPDKAMGFFHEFSGWVIFLVSLACLYLVHRTMLLIPAKGRPA